MTELADTTVEATAVVSTVVRARSVQTELLELTGMTTTERDALVGVVNGMLIYNTTDAKFQGYQAGSWQNLI